MAQHIFGFPRDGRSENVRVANPSRAGGLRLGRLLGFDIHLDFSVLFVAALVVMNFGGGALRAWHPSWSPVLRWSVAVAAAVLLFASILLHELAHAVVGRKLGVRIRRISLFLFGGLAHMESEPERPSVEFWMAVSGPLTSIALGAAAAAGGTALALGGVPAPGIDAETLARSLGPLPTLLLWLGPVNLFLGIFNLLPGFPLDGGRVFRALLWWISGDIVKATRVAAALGVAIAWTLIGLGVLMAFGVKVPVLGVGLVPGLWVALIGWFLSTAARKSFEQKLTSQALSGVSVERLMWQGSEAVAPEANVDAFVREKLLHGDQQCYPVVSSGRFRGLVCLDDVRRIPENDWSRTSVERAMTPVTALTTLPPTADAARALDLLGSLDVDQIPIVESGRLLGLIRRRDLLKWLTLRS